MGFLGSLIRDLLKAFCVPSRQEAQEPVYPVAGKPPSPYTQQIQQPGGYSAQYQYPPQQQWRPSQQPSEPIYSSQQQPQHPRPHKPHHGHGSHTQAQSQGPPQGPSSVPSPPPPAASQNQWTSSQPQQPQVVHPTSPRPPHGRVVRHMPFSLSHWHPKNGRVCRLVLT